MVKRRLSMVLALAAIVLVALVVWRGGVDTDRAHPGLVDAPGIGEKPDSGDADTGEGAAHIEAPVESPVEAARRRIRTGQGAPAPTVDARSRPGIPSERFEADAYGLQRMEIFGRFWRRAEDQWTAAEFAAATANAEVLSGEEAYQAYVYLRTCLDAPRSEVQAMGYFDRAEQALLRNPELAESHRFERWLSSIERGLARCVGLPRRDLELVAVEWLSRAANKGYPLAQIAFYRSYRWLLMRQPGLVTRDPGRVDFYRSLAPRFLTAALGSGHAEAFAEMAQALHDGIIYRRDPQAAYAYANAALEAGITDLEVAQSLLALLHEELTPAQRTAAEDKARDLCDQYCI